MAARGAVGVHAGKDQSVFGRKRSRICSGIECNALGQQVGSPVWVDNLAGNAFSVLGNVQGHLKRERHTSRPFDGIGGLAGIVELSGEGVFLSGQLEAAAISALVAQLKGKKS